MVLRVSLIIYCCHLSTAFPKIVHRGQPATFISERVVNVYLKFQWVKTNENSARTNNVVLMKREENVWSPYETNNLQTTTLSIKLLNSSTLLSTTTPRCKHGIPSDLPS